VKHVLTILLTTLMSSAVTVIGFAQVKATTPATPASQAPKGKTAATESEKAQSTVLTGRVTAVDAKAGTLTLKLKDKELNLTTNSSSTRAALERLKVGDVARVFAKGTSLIAASPVKAESKTEPPK